MDSSSAANNLSGNFEKLIGKIIELLNTKINIEIEYKTKEKEKIELMSLGNYLIAVVASFIMGSAVVTFAGLTLLFFLSIFLPIWVAALAITCVFGFILFTLYSSFKMHLNKINKSLSKSKPV